MAKKKPLFGSVAPGVGSAGYSASFQPEKREDPGALGKIFDLLQRPSRGIAEGTKRVVVDKKGADEFLKGLASGLAGKENVVPDFAHVLSGGNDKTPSRLQSVLGFGLDVAADPLTYTSAGVTKGVAKDVAEKEAVRKLSLAGTAAADFEPAVKRVTREIRDESPSHFYVKFGAGRHKATLLESRKLADAGERFAESLSSRRNVAEGANREIRSTAKMFSRKAEQPGGLDRITRLAEMGTEAGVHKEVNALVKVGEHLTPEQARTIQLAMDTGDLDPLKLMPAGDNKYGINTLHDYATLYRDAMKRWGEDEVKLGLRNAKDLQDDYVPRYLYGNEKNIEKGARGEKAVRVPTPSKNTVSATKEATHVPFDQLERLGFSPDMDIRSVVATRGAKHYAMVGKAKMIDEGLQHLKVESVPGNQKWLYEHDYVPASKVDHPIAQSAAYKNSWVPRDNVDYMNKINHFFENDDLAAKVLSKFDGVLNEWKFLATMTPQTRIRNLMSDFIGGAMDGVTDPRTFAKGRKVLKGVQERDVQDVLTKGLGRPGRQAAEKIAVGGAQVGIDDIWKVFTQSGGKAGYASSELARDIAPFEKGAIGAGLSRNFENVPGTVEDVLRVPRKAYGKVKQKVGRAADIQEDWMRVTHFIKAMGDELPGVKSWYDESGALKPEVSKAAIKANDRVRKWHLDYGNLTQFEKKYVKRAVPFYGFMRQAIPQQVGLLFTKPGFMAAYPKLANMASGFLSADGQSDDPMVPEWMRELSPFKVASEKGSVIPRPILKALFGGDGTDYIGTLAGAPPEVLNRLTPLLGIAGAVAQGRPPTLQEGLGAPLKEAVGVTSPFIKGPLEIAAGKNLYTGQDISDQGWGKYLSAQLPQSRVIQSGGVDPSAYGGAGLGRLLTGLDIRPITTQTRRSEGIRQVKELEKEYESHSMKMPNGDRTPIDARGRTLQIQIKQLRRFNQGPSSAAAPKPTKRAALFGG